MLLNSASLIVQHEQMLRCLWLSSAEVAFMNIDLTTLLQARLSVALPSGWKSWDVVWTGLTRLHSHVVTFLFVFMGSRAAPVDNFSSVKYNYSLFVHIDCYALQGLVFAPVSTSFWGSVKCPQWLHRGVANASESAYVAIVFAYCTFLARSGACMPGTAYSIHSG